VKAKHTNRLAESSSPYLLQHAHNPVDWFEWGPEAIEKARDEQKPILVSVGYSTCYWCHVMERQVFENEQIAALMNRWFVNIKVDREQRPDIDEIYMTATQLATGQGGWPNNVFLTPDLEPFYAGTYFPPEDTASRPGFPRVLEGMHDAWTNEREKVQDHAAKFAQAIRGALGDRSEEFGRAPLSEALVRDAAQGLLESYDPADGGFGMAPKFPQGFIYQFIFDSGDEKLTEAGLHTLREMIAGGMYDQVGGGFHRYSTDGQWKVPHFEKMLYNQAQLASAYARAHERTGEKIFEWAAHDVLAFVRRVFTSEEGAFYSAIDAETNEVEGGTFVWREQEIRDVLSEQEAALFFAVFERARIPEIPGHKHPDGGAVVVRGNYGDAAERVGVSVEELLERLTPVREKLLKRRLERDQPRLDDKVIAGWNGLMIEGMARAGRLLADDKAIRAAERAAEFAMSHLRREDGGLWRIWRRGEAEIEGFQEDYAMLARGLLELHRATGDEKWRTAAADLLDAMHERFWDDEHAGYFLNADDPYAIARTKSPMDSAVPSGNAIAVHALLDLYELTGDDKWLNRADETMAAFSGMMQRAARAMVHLADAVSRRMRIDAPLPEVGLQEIGRADGALGATDSLSKVSVSAKAPERVRTGEAFEIILRLSIDEGWHINAAEAGDGLIPTALDVRTESDVRVLGIDYPEAKRLETDFADGSIPVYEGDVVIVARLEVGENAPVGATIEIRLAYRVQACSETACLEAGEGLEIVKVAAGE